MQNAQFVISSEEKITTHELINSQLFKWIDENFSNGRIITMPAQSGKQENQILDYIQDQEKIRGESGLKLLTFDRSFSSSETNIDMSTPGRLWTHYRGDIFECLRNRVGKELPTAAWFDMIGGLVEPVREGIQASVQRLFAPGSLLFVTLQVSGGFRNIGQGVAKEVYGKLTDVGFKTGFNNTTKLIEQSVVVKGTKRLSPLDPFSYSYERKGKILTVFSYMVTTLRDIKELDLIIPANEKDKTINNLGQTAEAKIAALDESIAWRLTEVAELRKQKAELLGAPVIQEMAGSRTENILRSFEAVKLQTISQIADAIGVHHTRVRAWFNSMANNRLLKPLIGYRKAEDTAGKKTYYQLSEQGKAVLEAIKSEQQ